MVIEAVSEDRDVKVGVLAALNEVMPHDAILGTHTSALSVTELSVATGRPQQVIGTQFFNPATVQPFMEIVRTVVTEATGGGLTRTLAGVARAGVESRLSFRVPGTVQSVAVALGDRVRRGQALARLDAPDLELVLQDYMVRNAQSDKERLFYLGSALESLRTTFFRQTIFAEFELALYEAVERGEALSGERISSMYGEILRRYHGHDEGVVNIDELYTNEWMFVPHFYYNMYVFQYSTSKTAGTALYANILEEGEPAIENFKNLLRAGGSDYPYTLLTNAGVDLAQPGPYRAVEAKMNAIMDEMEALLDQQSSVAAAR